MLFKRDYGISCTIEFPLYDTTGVSLAIGATFAAGDLKIIKDGGAAANTTNLPTDEGNGQYSLVLTATEMQATHISLALDDQTATELWAGTGFQVETRITVGEYGGGVWFDGDSGATGTTVGVHGTPLRPVNSFSDALTLAGSSGTKLYRIFHLGGLSQTTVTASCANMEVIRIGGMQGRAILLSGSPSVTEARFENIDLQGAASSGAFTADRCTINSLSFGTITARDCVLANTLTPAASTHAQFHSCRTQNVSSLDTYYDMSADAATVVFRDFGGKMEFTNMDSTNLVDIEGTGSIVIAASCTGGSVTVRGQFEITDNSSGAVTISNTATGVNVTQISGSAARVTTLNRFIDTMEAVACTANTTSTTITAGALNGTSDNNYIDRPLAFAKDTTTVALRGRPTWVRSYNSATKTLTVDDLGTSPQTGDTFILLV